MARSNTAEEEATEATTDGEVQTKAREDAAAFLQMLQPATTAEVKSIKRGGGGGRRTSKWGEFVTAFIAQVENDPESTGVLAWPNLTEDSDPSLTAVVAGINNVIRKAHKAGTDLGIEVRSSKADKVAYIVHKAVAARHNEETAA